VAKEDRMTEQAKQVLDNLSADPKVQQMIRMREEGELLYRVDLTEARKEGEATGEARGEARGEAKGKRSVLFRLLERAGSALSPEQRQRIETCDDLSRLDTWIERLFAGDALEDILDEEG